VSNIFNAYASYYDLLYKDKDYKSEGRYVVSLLNQNKLFSGSMLELGCGTGKHAAVFADLGFVTHGIDSSIFMIDQANDRKSDTNIFELGDVRSFRANKKFDAVVSLFHVASYQTKNRDLLDMFLTAATHLEKDGIFIFDFWNGSAVLSQKPTKRVKKMSDTNFEVVRTATPKLNSLQNTVNVNFDILIKSIKNNKSETIKESHLMRYLFIPELKYLLNESGFEVLESLSWLSNDKLSVKDWQGLIVAKKIISS
jgi:SAM-dependent methyltransferase